MRIDATFKADLVKVKASTDSDSGTKTITPVVATKVKAEEAAALLGESFTKLAFGAFVEDEGDHEALFKRITPSIGCEKHTVKLVGYGPFPVIPILVGIKPVKGEHAVVATFELPLLFDSIEFGGHLLEALGEVIEVAMVASQMTLPGTDGGAPVRNNAGPFGNGKLAIAQ